MSKDYLMAKKGNKCYIVSPHWLEACMASRLRVPETDYPSTYNPRMSLDVVKNRSIVEKTVFSTSCFSLLKVTWEIIIIQGSNSRSPFPSSYIYDVNVNLLPHNGYAKCEEKLSFRRILFRNKVICCV